MRKHLTLMAIALLGLSACFGSGGSATRGGSSHAGDKPDWVMNPPTSNQYLYGVGIADAGDHESAKDQARRDLASQIRMGVNSIRSERTLASKTQTRKSIAESIERKVDENVRTDVQIKDLPGIEQEQRVDGKTNTYMLVKMDRQAWARSIRLRVNELDEKIQTAYDTIQNNMADDLNELQQAMRIYRELVPLFSKRQMWEERYQLAAPQSSLVAPPVDPVMIRTKLATLMSEITVALPQDPSSKKLLVGLTETLANRGLQVLDNPTHAMLQMEFSVSEVKRIIDGSVRLDGTASGSIRDSKGRVLGALEARATGGSSTAAMARDNMFKNLSKKIVDELAEQLFTYLTRL